MKETTKIAIRLDAARWGMAALTAATIAGTGSPVGAAASSVANGQKLYAARSCATCHKIGGTGGKIGPDLSKEGTKRNAQWLVKFFKKPAAQYPQGSMPPVSGPLKNRQDLAAYMLTLKK